MRGVRGGNPADLPLMQASKFELVINLRSIEIRPSAFAGPDIFD